MDYYDMDDKINEELHQIKDDNTPQRLREWFQLSAMKMLLSIWNSKDPEKFPDMYCIPYSRECVSPIGSYRGKLSNLLDYIHKFIYGDDILPRILHPMIEHNLEKEIEKKIEEMFNNNNMTEEYKKGMKYTMMQFIYSLEAYTTPQFRNKLEYKYKMGRYEYRNKG